MHFEWDDDKNLVNLAKHHVSFYEAQLAFADPQRVIARDIGHSDAIRIIGAGYWRKGKAFMKRKISYTDEPLGEIEVVPDFLPQPSELAFREEGVKVTLALSKKSVDFFKVEASKHQTQYQRMIRRLLDAYVDAQQAAPAPAPGASTRTPTKRAAV